MATTDGTAAFEKRKFADNSKLSMPTNMTGSVICIKSTVPEDSQSAYEYCCPSDGFFMYTINVGNGSTLWVRSKPTGFTDWVYSNRYQGLMGSESARIAGIIPAIKGQIICTQFDRSSTFTPTEYYLHFIPAQSAV